MLLARASVQCAEAERTMMRGAMGIMALLQHQLAPASSSCCTGMHALSTSPLASVPAAWLQRLLQLGQQQLPSYFSRLPLAGVAQAHGCATSSFTGLVRLYSTSSRLCSSSAVGSAASLLRVCIVGTGPAGFYTASQLLKQYGDRVRINFVDRLPTPFGLVRSGVAPDHQDVKSVNNQFKEVGRDPRCRFLGNVTLGKDVQLEELRRLYNAVVLAYGAESDRKLGIPGENARNVFAAREFVWWYNAHPDAAKLPVDLSNVESAAICGIGNVALDCARILLKGADGLTASDAASHALEALQAVAGKVKAVHLVARRGPVQAACTAKELKEIVSLPGVAVHAPAQQMQVPPADQAVMKAQRLKRRLYEIISQAAAKPKLGAAQNLHFQFYRNPVEVLVGSSGKAEGLKVEITALKEGPDGLAVAVGTGVFETISAQLILVSIGYKSLPVPGLPFDSRKGIVPNEAGRVLSPTAPAAPSATGEHCGAGNKYEPGLYVCGWLKRGPTGIVGTNLVDAGETVQCLAEDDAAGKLPGRRAEAGRKAGESEAEADLEGLLKGRGVRVVTFEEWLKLDSEEQRRGGQQGRVRSKIASVPEMLRLL